MRRALLFAAASIPVLALAVTATSGKLLETTNYSTTNDLNYVNSAQCQSGNLNLEWSIQTKTGVTFNTGGLYRVFATDTLPATDATTNLPFCAESSTTSPNTINAGPVGASVSATNVLVDATRSGNEAVKAAGKSCNPSQDGATIWICAHWSDATSTRNGSAVGKFQLQFNAPDAAGNVNVSAGDTKLFVKWDPATTGAILADHYIAEAYLPPHSPTNTPPDPADATAGPVTAHSTTITGLTNGQTYDVYVVAYSIGGNPGPRSKVQQGTPQPSADFWDVYKSRGGVEEGGCQSGPAGALAMLGVALLLAFRRRKS
jgi:MYXO-CTERM domain-containing protein